MQKFKIYFLFMVAVSLIFIQVSPLKSDSIDEKVKDFLKDFFQSPPSAIDQAPIRDYSGTSDLSEEAITQFKEIVQAHREARIENPGLSNITPRDIIIHRGGREIEEGTKRGWYNNEAPQLLLGETVEDRFLALPQGGVAQTSTGKKIGWSNDYWPITYGSLAMRYAFARHYPSFKEAFNSFQQPLDYKNILKKLKGKRLTPELSELWSPAEKYDLLLGDETFSLTRFLKNEGLDYATFDEDDVKKDEKGNVIHIEHLKEDVAQWMGKCHGWAAAATVVPRVTEEIELLGANGDTIHFHPDDIRGLITLKWAQSPYQTLFVGGRCNKSLDKKQIETDEETGAIYDQDCFDVNPGTFRIIIGNQVGLRKKSFVMDATFDFEVWNHPIRAFEVRGYFNPVSGNNKLYKSKIDGKIPEAAFVKYGSEKDRFKKLREVKWRDAHEHSTRWMDYKRTHGKEFRPSEIVGEALAVSYLVETFPRHGKPIPDQFVTVVYVYDLELDEQRRIVGGEWYTNKHPDFLWAVAKNEKPMNAIDHTIHRKLKLTYDGTRDKLSELNKYGAEGMTLTQMSSAKEGSPLGTIVDYLVSRTQEK